MRQLFNPSPVILGYLAIYICSLSACRTMTQTREQAASPVAPTPLTIPTEPQATPVVASQPVISAGYYPPNLVRTHHVQQGGPWCSDGGCATSQACGCGRKHGTCGVEPFRFNEQFPTQDPHTQWAPDGIERPWPHDEYIWDGGDRNADLSVSAKDFTVRGMDLEDTFVHYDTYSGKTEVSASNRVPLYAPRFAAVRHIVASEGTEIADRLALAKLKQPAVTDDDLRIVSNLNQPIPAVSQHGVKQTQSFRDRNAGLSADHLHHIAHTHNQFLAHENFELIRYGRIDNDEKPRLSQMANNALTWVDNKAVQVVIDSKLPLEAVNNLKLGETILYDRQGKPNMRIVKVADKSEAKPGEIIHFTLRFDNIGNEKVGNVTIIDNLTYRLEYVPETQECSHKHKFVTTANEGESLVLRWEIEDPIRAGEGGIIRFQCRLK
jgi:uncharacterized repeat protein (TIGR01451 family)